MEDSIDPSVALAALVSSATRLSEEKKFISDEILRLKKEVFYYHPKPKTFVCKGPNGKAIVEGKLLTFVSSEDNQIYSSYYQSNAKATLAALQKATDDHRQ